MSDVRDWREQHVMVTGAAGGLGRAVVRELLGRGARLTVTIETESQREELPVDDRLVCQPVDLGDESAVRGFYGSLDRIDASVHLVGGFGMEAIEKTSAESMRKMFELNVMTCFLCCREAIAAMGKRGGRLVNVAARPAVDPAAGMTAYAVSKAAVAHMTRCLAEEVRDRGILVNAIAPSIMDTPANRRAMPDADFGKWPKVEEVARAIAWLAGPENTLTSGAIVPVYGRA
ncbi:MAG: SDR family NAD(P)-dependent oxidoreductase [Phycisphaeraceae bacterium]|nr:SDR family NAD(P)-dependent oxidoreductase [Phycisphaeraceae bacterium]